MPESITYGGSAFLVAWFLLFFSGEIWGIDNPAAAELVVVLSLGSIGACFVTLIALTIIGSKEHISAKAGGKHFFILGLLLAIATVGTTNGHQISEALFLVSSIIIGFCGAFFLCASLVQLSRLSSRNMIITGGIIFLIGILIYSFAFYVPRELTVPILWILPLVAGPFYAMDKTEAPQKALQEHAQNKAKGWRAVVLLSIFMLFSCVIRGYVPFTFDNEYFAYVRSFSIILMLVAGAIVVIVPSLLPAKYQMSNLYRIILLVGVVFFALFPIFGMENPVVLVITDAYRGLCALITMTLLASMTRSVPFFGLKSVSGALSIYVLFSLIGWGIGIILHYLALDESVLRVYSSIQCVLVLVAFLLLYRQSEIEGFVDQDLAAQSSSEQLIDNEEQSEEAANQGGRFRQRTHQIAQEKGLTLREEEVFMLLAKGYKAQNISERLSVSYNTTRAHIRNIYQKCDVHSQQEFMELVENPSEDV